MLAAGEESTTRSELGSSGEVAAAVTVAAATTTHQGDGSAGGGNNGSDEGGAAGGGGGGGGGGGNRWPRQETLDLLRIRSEMDVVFRDSSAKGPLWYEVSRKMSELGYHRSAKKCREKFENVYKYHKRTKDGRPGKHEGKTYRFFEQLEALENHHHLLKNTSSLQPQPPPPPPAAVPPIVPTNPPPIATTSTTTNNPHLNDVLPHCFATVQLPPPQSASVLSFAITPSLSPANPTTVAPLPPPAHTSNSTSSSTFSDEGLPRELSDHQSSKRKRIRWKDCFERMMKAVMDKQEELHKNFLEAIEKRDRERLVREEAWRMQEMARIAREREILAQERSMAEAKDAALMSFLQKLAEQRNSGGSSQLQINNPPPPSQPPPHQQPPIVAVPTSAPPPPVAPSWLPPQTSIIEVQKVDNGVHFVTPGVNSSRWPKVEIEALIKLRTSLDSKYQENTPKGPLWEEISAGMKRLGYDRNAKRCKEKWENINKYFKKVKESNKRRREDSKTCPYFQQLDQLYREKSKTEASSFAAGAHFNDPMTIATTTPLMVTPEQQWPPQQHHQQYQQHQQQQQQQHVMDEMEGDRIDENRDDEDGEDDEDTDVHDHDDDDGDDEDGGEFEVVASKQPSSMGASATPE